MYSWAPATICPMKVEAEVGWYWERYLEQSSSQAAAAAARDGIDMRINGRSSMHSRLWVCCSLACKWTTEIFLNRMSKTEEIEGQQYFGRLTRYVTNTPWWTMEERFLATILISLPLSRRSLQSVLCGYVADIRKFWCKAGRNSSMITGLARSLNIWTATVCWYKENERFEFAQSVLSRA